MEALATPGDAVAETATPEYQSLSGLAVAALLLGLASPAALATPVLLAVPAAAVCIALLAGRSIRLSAGSLAGGAPARWGMTLALVSAAATVAHGPVRDMLFRRQMVEIADHWFTLVAQERWDDALSLLSGQAAANMHPPAQSPDAKPLPPEELKTIARERLRSDPLARCLSGKKPPLVVQLAPGAAPPVFDTGRATLSGDFTVSGAGDDGKNVCRVTLQCVRTAAYAASQPWRIDRWGETAAKTASR